VVCGADADADVTGCGRYVAIQCFTSVLAFVMQKWEFPMPMGEGSVSLTTGALYFMVPPL
jgi:hypothetical protein